MPKLAFLLDMDGVLYRGHAAIPAALDFLKRIEDHPFLFVTNNSAVSPQALVGKLAALGYPAFDPERVLNSAEATAQALHCERPGYRYFAVGGPGLHEALARFGTADCTEPDYVVVGEGEGLTYATLTTGINCVLHGGARLVGTNPDRNLDGTIDGKAAILPGGGALIAPFVAATGVEPIFIGKPFPWLFRAALRKLGSPPEATVMIGDRPDTDIKGAAELGLITVLVRTGRFAPGEPYPAHLPKPRFDIEALTDLDLDQLLT